MCVFVPSIMASVYTPFGVHMFDMQQYQARGRSHGREIQGGTFVIDAPPIIRGACLTSGLFQY